MKESIDMADITKCINKECPLRAKCYRFNAPDSAIHQSVQKFEFKEVQGEVKCEWIWEMEKLGR